MLVPPPQAGTGGAACPLPLAPPAWDGPGCRVGTGVQARERERKNTETALVEVQGGHRAARRPPPHLPHHRLLLPSPPGPQCLGRGEPRRDCALPSAPDPRNANTSPPPDPRHHAALRTPEAIAGPDGRAASSAVVLSCLRVPFSLYPQCFSGFFFPPSPSSPAPPLVQHR